MKNEPLKNAGVRVFPMKITGLTERKYYPASCLTPNVVCPRYAFKRLVWIAINVTFFCETCISKYSIPGSVFTAISSATEFVGTAR